MFSKLSRDNLGRSVIRSMLMSSHGCMGIGNGLRSPAGFWVYAFWHWQTWHFSINATIWRNMPGHQNCYCNILSTFLLEKCPWLWNSAISVLRSVLGATKHRGKLSLGVRYKKWLWSSKETPGCTIAYSRYPLNDWLHSCASRNLSSSLSVSIDARVQKCAI